MTAMKSMLEHFRKSVTRFFDQKCDQQRNLAHFPDSNKIGNALVASALLMGAGCTTPVVPSVPVPGAPAGTAPIAASYAPAVSDQAIMPAPDREEILDTLDRFFEALASGDARTLEIILAPEALSVTVYPEQPGRPVRYGKMRAFADAMRAGRLPKIEEPYWNPIVLQRKGLAVVWAPYEAWINEHLSHCGIDVFNMTRQKTAWRIDSIHWTQEPSACAELWPEGRSVLRPGMFNDPDQ